MKELLTFRQHQDRALFFAACVIAAVSYAAIAYYNPESTNWLFRTALCGSAIVILLILSERMRRKEPERLHTAIVLRTAAFIIPGISVVMSEGYHYELDFLIPILLLLPFGPAAAAMKLSSRIKQGNLSMFKGSFLYWLIFALTGLIFLFANASDMLFLFWPVTGIFWYLMFRRSAENRYDPDTERTVYWRAWNATEIFLLVSQTGWFSMVSYHNYFHYILITALPFILPYVYRLFSRPELCGNETLRSLLNRLFPFRYWAYFGSCILLYLFSEVIMYETGYDRLKGNPILCVYYIVMAAVVYRMESHAEEKRLSDRSLRPKRGIIPMVVFVGICLMLVLNLNSRTAEILFEKPRVYALNRIQENWVEYKQDAVTAFFANDIHLLRDKYKSWGYDTFLENNRMGYMLYRNKPFILLYSICIIALSLRMAGRKTGSRLFDRMSRYMAAGWLIRTALYLPLAVTMTPITWVIPPFAVQCFMEVFVLAGFLTFRTAPQLCVSETGEGRDTEVSPALSQPSILWRNEYE